MSVLLNDRMLLNVCLLLLLFFKPCVGIIYQLNDTEYKRLPPLAELEDYEACIEQSDGIYCVVKLQLYADSGNDLYQFIQEYSEHTVKHYNYSVIDRGVCVTRSCETYPRNASLAIGVDLRDILEGCLNQTVYNKYGLMARVNYMSCNKKIDEEQIHVDYLDLAFAVVCAVLLMLVVAGSYCDRRRLKKSYSKKVESKVEELLLCFSIYGNYKRLSSDDVTEPGLSVFKGIHGIRVLANAGIVYGHTFFLISGGFNSDPHTFEKAYEHPVHRVCLSGSNVVQVFFFFASFLLTYYLQYYAEIYNANWKMIPKIVFQRWCRLTPAAAITIGFMATWMRHLGSGPLWSVYVSNGPSEQCRRFFWTHMFYFNNYVPENLSCAYQTWHIATDMQLLIVGLIIHFLIKDRSGTFKIISLMTVLLVGMASPAVHVWYQGLDAFCMQKPEVYRTLYDATFRKSHVLGHNNLPCYVIGMAAGYWIYYLQQKKVEYPNSKIGNFLCWCVIPLYICLLYCGSLFYNDGERASLALTMLYAATNRAVVGILCTVWLTGLVFKCNGLSRAVFEWSGFAVLSKLTYSVYLLHSIFLTWMLGIRTQLSPVTYMNMLFTYFGVLVFSYAVSLPFYLLVEAPTTRLLKFLSRGEVKKKIN